MYVPSQLVPFMYTNPDTFSSPSTVALSMSPVKHIHTCTTACCSLIFSRTSLIHRTPPIQ